MSVTSPSGGRDGSPTSLAASISGGMKDLGPLVGAIDQGTGSTRFLVFAANTAELVTCELKCKPMSDVPSLTTPYMY